MGRGAAAQGIDIRDETGRQWQATRAALVAHVGTGGDPDDLVDGAQTTFAVLHRWLDRCGYGRRAA